MTMSGSAKSGIALPTVQTLDRSDVALSFRRRVTIDGAKLETPTKAIPASKLYRDDEVLEEVRGVNEFYKQVSSADLYQSPDDGELHLKGLDRQLRWSREGEIDFTFLEYTDSEQISKIDAFQMVGIEGYASDYYTVPIQSKIYKEIEEDNGLDDIWYQKLRNGTELFLRACHESEENKPIMGGIPPLDMPHLEDLIDLYEQYDVFAYYFDFDWNLPTKRDKVDRIGYFLRRIANQRHHNDILLYALNARSGTFDGDVGYRPAADFAPALMGFDILGGNHTGPNLDPDRAEEMEEREEFRLFSQEISGYIGLPLENLDRHFPENTNVSIEELRQRGESYSAKRRYEKFLNAEQMGLLLDDLRQKLESGESAEYIENRTPNDRAIDAGSTVRDLFDEGLQTELGEYT